MEISPLKLEKRGLPRWLSGKEPACQCRRHGLHPWPGKTPHAEEHQSLHQTAGPVLWGPGPQLLSPRAAASGTLSPQSLCSTARDATSTQSLLTTTREKSPPATKTQYSQNQSRYKFTNALKIRKEVSSYSEFILAVILSQEPCQECLSVRVMIDEALLATLHLSFINSDVIFFFNVPQSVNININ